jgi:hypothetical protein
MRTNFRVIVGVLMVVAAGCSGGEATTTAAPTTTAGTTAPQTTTTLPPLSAQCSDALADPNARFVIIPPFDVFACFDVESYRSRASYEGTPVFPNVPETGSASIESDQLLDKDGQNRARVVSTTAGVEYVTLQFGDSLYLQDGTALTDEIPVEVFQSQLAMNQAISDGVAGFSSIARDVGSETIDGVETTHYQASSADIALSFEEKIARELGGEPFTLELPGTQLDLWVDVRGIVLKIGFIFDFSAATANGTPAQDYLVDETPLDMILPTTSGTARYELYGFGDDISVELPTR